MKYDCNDINIRLHGVIIKITNVIARRELHSISSLAAWYKSAAGNKLPIFGERPTNQQLNFYRKAKNYTYWTYGYLSGNVNLEIGPVK